MYNNNNIIIILFSLYLKHSVTLKIYIKHQYLVRIHYHHTKYYVDFTCLGKHNQWSMSRLRWQSPGFLSAGEHRPFSRTPGPGPPVPLPEPQSIWRTSSWFRSTWKSADTFLPSLMSSRDSVTKNGSIWKADSVRWLLEIWEFHGGELLQMLTSKCRSVKSKCFRSLHWWLVPFHSRWCSPAAWGWAIGMLSWTFCPVSPQMDALMRYQPSARPLGSSEPAFGKHERRKGLFYKLQQGDKWPFHRFSKAWRQIMMSFKQIETINRFQTSLFYLLEYLGQARTDSTFPLSWQSGFLHLSLRCTGRWTEREQLNAADKKLAWIHETGSFHHHCLLNNCPGKSTVFKRALVHVHEHHYVNKSDL